MSNLFRSILNYFYSSTRGLGAAFDPRLSTGSLALFGFEKMFHLFRGFLRLRKLIFLGTRVRIRGQHRLTLGKRISISQYVEIDARSINGITIGDSSTIDSFAILRSSGVLRNLGIGIHIGHYTSIGARNFLHGGGGIVIGRGCLLGPDVKIFSENHVISSLDVEIRDQGEIRSEVVIEDDVWVGAGAIILAGVHVGQGAVIAAGSVVTRSIPAGSIVAGVPARVIRMRGV